MTIGERIRDARKSIKLSQTELGDRLQIGKSSVSEWESGKRPIPIDAISEIASVLNVSVPYLMGWNVDNEAASFSHNQISPAALEIARKYDWLDEHGKAVVEAVINLESLREPDYASEVERFNRMADGPIESTASKKLG
jgi:transcriptional regulator with XRE-family HTH domain